MSRCILLAVLCATSAPGVVSTAISVIMYQVDPRDLSVFATAFGVIFSIGFLASWIPARRATGVDPMTALRYE